MPDKSVFLDSNMIIYAYSDDGRKKDVSIALLKMRPIISLQVINEVMNVGMRKLHLPYSDLRELFALLKKKCEIKPVECVTIERALTIVETYKYSYFDSLMIASALEHDCRTLYSEDLQHGQIIEGLQIVNPFRDVSKGVLHT